MQTLYDKLWQSHVVYEESDKPDKLDRSGEPDKPHEHSNTVLLYIDRHLVHEVTSPQAFEGLKLAGRKPWRKEFHTCRG